MKSFGCIILLLAIFAVTSFAATARGNFNDPRNPGKCTIKENLVLSPGEEIKDPNAACGRIICGRNGFAEFQTCGTQSVEGCKMGDYVDKTLPYPECCKRHIICD